MSVARLATVSLLLGALGLLAWAPSGAMTPASFMSLAELEVGMEGTGRTTVRAGEGVETFKVRIIGISDSPGDLNDAILVRSRGEVIDHAGGYAQGMSGSPIYVNDRLIGAFYGAFAFSDSPNPIGLVRPIETMLPLAEGPSSSEGARPDPDSHVPAAPTLAEVRKTLAQASDAEAEEITFVSDPPSLAERRATPDRLYAVPMRTPLWVSGLSGRSQRWLASGVDRDALAASAPTSRLENLGPARNARARARLSEGLSERLGLSVRPAASLGSYGSAQQTPSSSAFPDFAAGRPMAAMLAQGDVQLGSVCTTSYVNPDADTLLACGHQILMTGESQLLLGKARVVDTVNSAQISFVLPELQGGTTHGVIQQDRMQAISAAIGQDPEPITLNARIIDQSRDKHREMSVQLSDTGNVLPSVLFASLLQGVDTTINRIGQGTMTVRYRVSGANLPNPLERTDVFTSNSDIAIPGLQQVAQAVFFLQQNEFANPKLRTIDVEITISEAIEQTRIVALQTDQDRYEPGDTIRYEATLRAYRGEERTVEGTIALPEDLGSRRLTVQATGGGTQQQQQQQQQNGSQTPEFPDLEALINAIEQSQTNNQLTVRLQGLPRSQTQAREGARQTPSQSFNDVHRLEDGVVVGQKRSAVTVDASGSEQSPDEDDDADDDADSDDEEGEDSDDCPSIFYC